MRGEIQQWSEILTHGNWACNKVPHPHDEFILSTCSFWGSHRGLHSEPQRDRNGALSPSDPRTCRHLSTCLKVKRFSQNGLRFCAEAQCLAPLGQTPWWS
jgi:hypothetical protein